MSDFILDLDQMENIEKILERGQEFYHRGDLEKSIELFEKNESIVQIEGFEDYLKIQFYLLH